MDKDPGGKNQMNGPLKHWNLIEFKVSKVFMLLQNNLLQDGSPFVICDSAGLDSKILVKFTKNKEALA